MGKAFVCDVTGAMAAGESRHWFAVDLAENVRAVVSIETRADANAVWNAGAIGDRAEAALREAMQSCAAQVAGAQAKTSKGK